MESDADRLESIKALGGLLVRASDGDFWAIFDSDYADGSAGDAFSDSSSPRLTARTSDVSRITTRSPLSVNSVAYRVTAVQPDGTGMSTLILAES